jgi:hypothetical protein
MYQDAERTLGDVEYLVQVALELDDPQERLTVMKKAYICLGKIIEHEEANS